MNLLAIDTSTETLSLAVCSGSGAQQRVWAHEAPGGANASTHLIGATLELLKEAQLSLRDLQAIAFGAGPGSFTGLRTACAVAQGMGFGAGVPLLPVDSLLAVAQSARTQQTAPHVAMRVTALLDARMDEMYAADYFWDGTGWQTERDCILLHPEGLAAWMADQPAVPPGAFQLLAGNVFAVYAGRLTHRQTGVSTCVALPAATACLALAPLLIARGGLVPAERALPRYIRDKVAKTTAERLAEKAQLPGATV